MGFSKGLNVQLATLFGIGKIPGGGTWASLIVLLIALYEQNAATVSFLAFFTLIIGPRAYRRLINNSTSEDPKEYVLDKRLLETLQFLGYAFPMFPSWL